MANNYQLINQKHNQQKRVALKFLYPDQVAMIDDALEKLGQFGEVRIVVEKGKVRFLVLQKSIDALKWKSDAYVEETVDF